MVKPNHHVVTSSCQLFLIVEEKKAPYLLIKAKTVQGEIAFTLRDKKMLRQLAKDISEELPEPKKRKPRAGVGGLPKKWTRH